MYIIILIPACLRCDRVCQDKENQCHKDIGIHVHQKKKQSPTFHLKRSINATREDCLLMCLAEIECMQFRYNKSTMLCDHMTSDVVDFEKEAEGYFKYCIQIYL